MRAGTYANLVRQAKSKQKILDKMEAAGLTPPVKRERTFTFTFPDCEKLPPPVLPFQDVSFAYSGKEEDMLYRVRGCMRCARFPHACGAHLGMLRPGGCKRHAMLVANMLADKG